MPTNTPSLKLPNYDLFSDAIAVLDLPISASELHGILCGYLCAGAVSKGDSYLRTLLGHKQDVSRGAALALFGVFAVSAQQIANFDFEFELLLPDDQESLVNRAQAFSEWCEGFSQGITLAEVSHDQLDDEETQEALQHVAEFAQLDPQSLHVDEEDERAFMEITEYTRMAVLRIHNDLQALGQSETAH